jgi:hypothetical protein
MTAAHRAPVRIPRTLQDPEAQRAADSQARQMRDMQSRKRRFPVRVRFPSSADPLSTETVFDAYTKTRLVSADWDQGAAIAASGTDYWTFTLRALDGKGGTRIVGEFSTASDSVVALRRRPFSLRNAELAAGERLTISIAETGAAAAYGPGSLSLLLEEVD